MTNGKNNQRILWIQGEVSTAMGTACRKMQEEVSLGISKVMGRVRADNRAVSMNSGCEPV